MLSFCQENILNIFYFQEKAIRRFFRFAQIADKKPLRKKLIMGKP